jgi:hypothetical protein
MKVYSPRQRNELHKFLVSLMNDVEGIKSVRAQFHPITGEPWAEHIHLSNGVYYTLWQDPETDTIKWRREYEEE